MLYTKIMQEIIIPFFELFLLTPEDGILPDATRVLASTSIGCFAPCSDAPNEFVPGFLTVNYVFKIATFGDLSATEHARRLGRFLTIPALIGMVSVGAASIAALLELDAPPWSDGLFANPLFQSGLIGVGVAILLAILVVFVGGRLKSAGTRSVVELPEPLFRELCIEYERQQAIIKESSDQHARPKTLANKAGKKLAESAIEAIASSVVPSGIAKLAAGAAIEVTNSEGDDSENSHMEASAIASMASHLVLAHQNSTGRHPVRITMAAFQAIGRVTKKELIEFHES